MYAPPASKTKSLVVIDLTGEEETLLNTLNTTSSQLPRHQNRNSPTPRQKVTRRSRSSVSSLLNDVDRGPITTLRENRAALERYNEEGYLNTTYLGTPSSTASQSSQRTRGTRSISSNQQRSKYLTLLDSKVSSLHPSLKVSSLEYAAGLAF